MNAATVSKAVLLGACALALTACNLMMPSPMYTSPRQDPGFRLLSTVRLEVKESEDRGAIRGAVLDGDSVANTYKYNVVLNQYFGPDLAAYRVDELGYASFYSLQEMYANNLDAAVADNIGGFLCNDNAGEIDRVNFGIGTTEVQISTMESAAQSLLSGAKLGGVAWSATGAFRSLAYANGDLAVGSHNPIGGAMTQVGPGPFAGGIPAIVSTFQTLTDSGGGFWGQNYIEFGKFGFSQAGAFSWFVARRVDNVRGIKEERLVSLPDAGGAPITSPHRPLGTAGAYIIAYDEKRAPAHQVLVLDGGLGTRTKLRIVGDDYVYLGERDLMIDAMPTPHALFLVMTRHRLDDETAELYLNLYAYPVSGL